MRKYIPPKINYGKRRAKLAIPDQSLSIQEIVKRYVRGVPVDVVQRKGVYLDQSDEDMEKLSRMDFHEKSEYAAFLKERSEALKLEIDEHHRLHKDAQDKRQQEIEAQTEAKIAAAIEKRGKRQPPEKQDGVN